MPRVSLAAWRRGRKLSLLKWDSLSSVSRGSEPGAGGCPRAAPALLFFPPVAASFVHLAGEDDHNVPHVAHPVRGRAGLRIKAHSRAVGRAGSRLRDEARTVIRAPCQVSCRHGTMPCPPPGGGGTRFGCPVRRPFPRASLVPSPTRTGGRWRACDSVLSDEARGCRVPQALEAELELGQATALMRERVVLPRCRSPPVLGTASERAE